MFKDEDMDRCKRKIKRKRERKKERIRQKGHEYSVFFNAINKKRKKERRKGDFWPLGVIIVRFDDMLSYL